MRRGGLALALWCLGACGSGSSADDPSGTYVGSYGATRQSDTPTSDPTHETVQPATVVIEKAGDVFRLTLEGGCVLTSSPTTTNFFVVGQSCVSQALMRNATLSVRGGYFSSTLPGVLELNVAFHYQRTDNSDSGTLTLGYGGNRR